MSKIRLLYIATILLFLLLAFGVWMYFEYKIKQVEKNYGDKPTSKEILKTNKPICYQLQNGIYL